MWSWRVLGCLVLVGCGRLGFDARSDANARDGATPDLMLGAWGPAMPVPITTGAMADDPTLTDDELELYYNTGPLSSMTIMVSTRTDRMAPWPTPVLAPGTPASAYSPHVSGDGLTLWYGGGGISFATRASRTAAWTPRGLIAELDSPNEDDGPAVTADELAIVFDSDRAAAGNKDLYISTRPTKAASWSPPVPIAELNTAANEERPFLSADRLRLYFQAPGPSDGYDLWVATRADPSALFDPPQRLPFSTPGFDEDPWESADGRHLLWGTDEVLMEAFR